jgi:hypothetical protein
MDARQILSELDALGVTLTAQGTRIGFRPASRVPHALLQRMREQKPALLQLLTSSTASRAKAPAARNCPKPTKTTAKPTETRLARLKRRHAAIQRRRAHEERYWLRLLDETAPDLIADICPHID